MIHKTNINFAVIKQETLDLMYSSNRNKMRYKWCIPILRNDVDIFMEAIKMLPLEFDDNQPQSILKYASLELQENKKVVLIAVSQYGSALEFASDKLRDDREVVLIAVSKDGLALEFASDKLRNDREVVLIAIKQNGSALEFASAELCADRDIVLIAIASDCYTLSFASTELCADKEVVLIAIAQDGCVLEYASPELRADRDLVLIAVSNSGTALEYALANLNDDKEVVLIAVAQEGHSLKYASAKLRADKEVVLTAVSKNINGDDALLSLAYASNNLRADKEVVLTAVMQNGTFLEYASANLQADREVVINAVNTNGDALIYASKIYMTDKEIVLLAIKGTEPLNNKYINECFYDVNEIILNAIKYCSFYNLLFYTDFIKNIKINQRWLLLMLQRCNEPYYHTNRTKRLLSLESTLNVNLTELNNIALNTNLRIGLFPGIALTIQSVEFNKSNNLYSSYCTSIAGSSYTIFDMEEPPTFNLFSIKIKEKYAVCDIAFVINDHLFDLGDYNKNCMECFNNLMNK